MTTSVPLPALEQLPPQAAEYRCPGESQPISRALHLSRLASGFAACRNCARNTECGSLPQSVVREIRQRISQQSAPLISSRGIRGLSLNALTRERMTIIVMCAISLIEEDRTKVAEVEQRLAGRPRILLGHDHRDCSADLAQGAVTGLRRMSCDIGDAGTVTRPEFDFALRQCGADAGLFITGGIEKQGWSGLDILDRDGIPWCAPGRLDDLRSLLDVPQARLSRTGGGLQSVDVAENYEAALAWQFHAITPLQLGLRLPEALPERRLQRMLDRTPCTWHLYSTTSEPGITSDGHQQFPHWLRSHGCDVGLWIADDAQACTVFDETGREQPPTTILQWLLQAEAEAPQPASAREGPADSPAAGNGSPIGSRVPTRRFSRRVSLPRSSPLTAQGRTHADLIREQRRLSLRITGDGAGRLCFLGETPECDALLTLAKVLRSLSDTDARLSQCLLRLEGQKS